MLVKNINIILKQKITHTFPLENNKPKRKNKNTKIITKKISINNFFITMMLLLVPLNNDEIYLFHPDR